MKNGMGKWILVGSIIGASAGMVIGGSPKSRNMRRKLMKNGRNLLRHSGETISGIADMFR